MEGDARVDLGRPQDSNRARPLPPQVHRVTNFYIADILRPDFGRRGKDGPLPREDGSPSRVIRRHERAGSKSSTTGTSGGSRDRDQELNKNQSDCAARRPEAEKGRAGPADASLLWPAWVYCTRYSDRPSAGPRSRKPKRAPGPRKDDKRPRTAFTAEQLLRLKAEFQKNRYLTEQRRQVLARELGLNESQIKIWFQNKRAKIKKSTGNKNSLALSLMAQGLYNHSTARDSDSD